MTLLRTVARPMLASMFVVGGVNAFRSTPQQADKAEPVTDMITPVLHKVAPQVPIPDDPQTLVRINGAVHIGFGLMLATGRLPRISALVLAGTLVPTTLAGHRFWEEKDPGARTQQTMHFLKNVSMMGGLMMASLDPDPHKQLLVRRAAHKAGAAKDRVVEILPGG